MMTFPAFEQQEIDSTEVVKTAVLDALSPDRTHWLSAFGSGLSK